MIRVTTDGDHSTVTFPYDAEAVDIIRTIPCRHWDPKAKTWRIETSWVRLLATRMTRQGFDVTIDGQPFIPEPPAVAVAKPPLIALFAVLPAHLRQPVYRALCKVLHPDAGGDTELMKQLNRAMDNRR